VPGKGIAGYSRELLRGALIYDRRGIPVFPCEAGGKRPLTADGFFEATTDEARIRGWWGRWPNANVAIPTGERSKLLVLDVDSGEGTDSVALLELSRGQAPKTARAATGGGGMHLYFRYPSPQELMSAGLYTRHVRNSQGLLGDGLDVRGEGGYVVAPPSSTQRAYRWIDRSPPPAPPGCSDA
jgi:Bifunctional DNA primase/polymerase, N-terminal